MTHGLHWYVDRWIARRQMRGAVVRLQTIPVYCEAVPKGERDATVDRVAKALDLIHNVDRRRTDRLERDGVGIVLAPGYGQHAYSEGTNTIHLDFQLVEERSVASLAVSIVHEATHARFARAGVYYNRRRAPRMERRCIEEEIAFVQRQAHTSEAEYANWVARRRALLAQPWWTRRGRLRTLVRMLDADGAPQWLIRLARRLAR